MTVTYLVGDATRPQGEGPKVIVHCCNDAGGWGSGFVLALNARWSKPRECYREWFREGAYAGTKFELGAIQIIEVEADLCVVNLIGQHGYGKCSDPNDPFVRYDAVRAGLSKLISVIGTASIHMPRIGCGLAGGTWWEMGPIIEEVFKDHQVFVYDFEPPM